MRAAADLLAVNPMFLRYDLLIELGRVELAIDAERETPANEPAHLAELETRRATLSDTLRRLRA